MRMWAASVTIDNSSIYSSQLKSHCFSVSSDNAAITSTYTTQPYEAINVPMMKYMLLTSFLGYHLQLSIPR